MARGALRKATPERVDSIEESAHRHPTANLAPPSAQGPPFGPLHDSISPCMHRAADGAGDIGPVMQPGACLGPTLEECGRYPTVLLTPSHAHLMKWVQPTGSCNIQCGQSVVNLSIVRNGSIHAFVWPVIEHKRTCMHLVAPYPSPSFIECDISVHQCISA